ncbi:MAG TPA: ABC transporter permease subunit, partial [Aggregatilineales bacterium]|nr:ABC transporter permease subunit [Aggregatilineales bacterium]
MLAVFRKSLRDSRKMTLWLSIGLGIYAIMIVSFYPAILEQRDNLNEMLKSYPKELMAMMYGETDLDQIDIADPGGFVQAEYGTWVMLILGAVAIAQAFNALTNSERDGTLDVMLSFPVSRQDYLLGRFFATALGILIMQTAGWIGFVIGSQIWTEFNISAGDLALITYGAFFPIMVFTTFTYLLATFTPSSKRFAGAIAYLFMIGSYLIYGLSSAVESLQGIRPFIVYDYYRVN